MFNWHRSFSLGLTNPWKKGKKKVTPDNKVVLTNVKMLSNGYPAEIMLPGEISSQQSFCQTDGAFNCQDNESNKSACQSKGDCALAFSDVASAQSSCPHRGLYKFESEDSGVELPSGANSPSTPTGSEQSFVVHSRDSSCDSGVLSASSSPAIDHAAAQAHKDTNEANNCVRESTEQGEECNLDLKEPLHPSAAIFNDLSVAPENGSHSQLFPESPKMYDEKNSEELDFLPTGNPSTASADEPVPMQDAYNDSLEGPPERNVHGPLKRYPTSDSLDEYMDECCRLSEVNQGSAKALGPGLGYLEHICQLIEKIGQLQEHNLRLQKQICSLQKERKMKQLKEEYFVQHCSCGAARPLRNSYQEAKKHFNMRSRPHSMFIPTGNLSDLSMIPEMAGHCEGLACRGSESHMESGSSALMLGLRETSNRSVCEETEATQHVWSRVDGAAQQDQALRRVENHPWGRMRELVKKTKLMNPNKLGLSSMALKRSCPQLYRPDISSEPKKKDRNSMIFLGQSPANDSAWPY